MFHKVMTISPTEAREILDTKNSKNRPISQNAVDKFAQMMKRHEWKLNGQPICFGKSGQLLNGQHRLKACIQANTEFETSVMYGVDDDTFNTIDDNNSRSFSDVLAIEGENNHILLAAGIRYLWVYATGEVERRDLRRGVIATKQVLQSTFEKHPKIRQSVKMVNMLKARPGGLMISAGMAVGLHYLFSLVDEKKADEFMITFQSGFGLNDGHPIAVLRSRLITAQRDRSSKLTKSAEYFYTVTAWNAFVQGKPMSRMSYVPDLPPIEIENLPKKTMKDML